MASHNDDGRKRCGRTLLLERLEDRCLLSVYTVNVTDDVNDGAATAGHTSLREAILAANASPGADSIAFNIAGTGTQTIRLLSALPTISQPVVLDGTTQPGFAGSPIIELEGSAAGTSNGLVISAGSSTVSGLAIDHFSACGIKVLAGASGVSLEGNLIYSNGGEDIDLGGDGWLGNDTGDDDSGANGLLNWPELTRAAGAASGYLRITGQTAAGATVEMFHTATAYGHQDATSCLGSVTADASGAFSVDVPVAEGGLIATATDTAGNTSEFSLAVPTGSGAVDVAYLLVTNEALASAFQPLVDRRTAQGKPGALVTVEWIAENYDGTRPDGGSDLQTQIRNCIQDYYEHHGTRWVALAGDETVVACRDIQIGPGTFASPVDAYYSVLDGTWDSNGNGVYGEIGIDDDYILPEVAIGRIPVRTADQATVYINKVITYETRSADGFANSMLLATAPSGVLRTGESRPSGYQDHEPVDAWEYDTTEFYRNEVQPYWQAYPLGQFSSTLTSWDTEQCGDYDLTYGNLQTQLNWGYNYVYLSGHGNATGWQGGEGGWVSAGMASGLTNSDRFGIYYADACGTAGFYAAEPSLSEALLRNPNGGAVAYIGQAESAQYNPSFTAAFFREIFECKRSTIGEAFAASRAVSDWYYRREQSLQGDPALLLMGEESGRHLQVLSPNGCEIEEAGTSVTIRWNATGTGFASDEAIKIEYSDDSGESWHAIAGADAVPCRSCAFDWDTTGLAPGSHYRVRITSVADPAVVATSNRDFKIALLGLLTVLSTPSETAGNASIWIDGNCANYTNYTYTVEIGQTVTLTATGQGQYNFVGWADSAGNTLTCQSTTSFTLAEDTTVVAEFELAGASRNYYVNDDVADADMAAGSDENDGLTPQTPMRHLQAMLDRYVDIAVIHVGRGTYEENLTITDDDPGVVVEGAGAETILDGTQAGSCVRLDTAADATLRRMTLRNGKAEHGGGIYCSRSELTLSEVTLTGNSAVGNGGAVCTADSTLTVTDCLIDDNTAGGVGGGVYSWNTTVTLTGGELCDNSATGGGGIFVDYASTAEVAGVTLRGNQATGNGGAVCASGGTLTVTDCLIDANTAGGVGGGIDLWYTSLTLTGGEVCDNSATSGGAIFVDNGSKAELIDARLRANQATGNSGAIGASGGTLIVTDCLFDANTAGGVGGGIDLWYSSASLSGNEFYGNSATWGGGIYVDAGSTATVSEDAFYGNHAARGGAVCAAGSTTAVTLTNGVLAGNTATSSGGALAAWNGATLTIVNCSISGNVAQATAGGLAVFSGAAATLSNCVLWADTAPSGHEIWLDDGSTFTAGYSDMQGGQAGIAQSQNATLNWLAGNIDADPVFTRSPSDGGDGWGVGENDDYGDLHLASGSPAIDTGTSTGSPALDRDGTTRPADGNCDGSSGYDLGAYETWIQSNLDADGNGQADALTDGILILRYLFDAAGAWNYSDALGSGATRTARTDIKTFLDLGVGSVLDVDGNGAADALTDGILILRYLFDPAGAWNYSDALGSGATRTTRAEIRAYLDLWNPGLAAAVARTSDGSAPAAAETVVEADSFAETNAVTETSTTVLVGMEIATDAGEVVETVAAAGVGVEVPKGEIGDDRGGGEVGAGVGAGCERVEGQDTLKHALQRQRAVDCVDLQSVVEQELGGSAAGELVGRRLPGGLGRGVRAAQVDSLFGEGESGDWFQWR